MLQIKGNVRPVTPGTHTAAVAVVPLCERGRVSASSTRLNSAVTATQGRSRQRQKQHPTAKQEVEVVRIGNIDTSQLTAGKDIHVAMHARTTADGSNSLVSSCIVNLPLIHISTITFTPNGGAVEFTRLAALSFQTKSKASIVVCVSECPHFLLSGAPADFLKTGKCLNATNLLNAIEASSQLSTFEHAKEDVPSQLYPEVPSVCHVSQCKGFHSKQAALHRFWPAIPCLVL